MRLSLPIRLLTIVHLATPVHCSTTSLEDLETEGGKIGEVEILGKDQGQQIVEMASSSDNTERNRAHFDEHASSYTQKWSNTISQIIAEIQKRKDWIGVDWVSDSSSDSEEVDGASSSSAVGGGKEKKTVRLLDYACGPGTVSRALLPYITSAIGIDLSSSMVSEFNTLASNQGLSKEEMHAVVGNLVNPGSEQEKEFEGKEYWDFDIAVVGLGFHHFDDPGLAAKRLVQRLKKGGVLMIIDFLPHSGGGGGSHTHSHGHDHSHSHGKKPSNPTHASAIHTVAHHGFSLEDVKLMFEEAGAGKDFDVANLGGAIVFSQAEKGTDGKVVEKVVTEVDGGEFKRTVFMARGVKL